MSVPRNTGVSESVHGQTFVFKHESSVFKLESSLSPSCFSPVWSGPSDSFHTSRNKRKQKANATEFGGTMSFPSLNVSFSHFFFYCHIVKKRKCSYKELCMIAVRRRLGLPVSFLTIIYIMKKKAYYSINHLYVDHLTTIYKSFFFQSDCLIFIQLLANSPMDRQLYVAK